MSNNRTLDYGNQNGRRALVKDGFLRIYGPGGNVELELSRDETRELLSLLYDYRAEILNGPEDAGMEDKSND